MARMIFKVFSNPNYSFTFQNKIIEYFQTGPIWFCCIWRKSYLLYFIFDPFEWWHFINLPNIITIFGFSLVNCVQILGKVSSKVVQNNICFSYKGWWPGKLSTEQEQCKFEFFQGHTLKAIVPIHFPCGFKLLDFSLFLFYFSFFLDSL